MRRYTSYLAVVLSGLVVASAVFAQDDDDFNWTALEDLDEEVTTKPAVVEPVVLDEPVLEDLLAEPAVLDEPVAEPVLIDEPADEPVKLDTPIADALDLDGDFNWDSDERSSGDTKQVTGNTGDSTASADASQAYGELLRENLELRKKIGSLGEEAESAQKAVNDALAEKQQLVGVVQNLESTLNTMTTRIDTIKKEQASTTENLDKTIELEEQLSKAETEKALLMNELQTARNKASEKESKVKAGSALFKQVERDNAKLKDKLVEVETARMKAEEKSREASLIKERAERDLRRVEEKEDRIADELKEAKARDKDRRKVIDKMLKQIPSLEKELVKLSADVEQKEAVVGSQEKDIELLRSELARRDRRFVKAERMAELLEQARNEVKMVSNVEKRDMHYNMAVVYAKEGRHRDAEREYLRALKLDPTDPSVHYNLGILYEDELGKTSKAILHYKKYLQLSPFATDSDTVKQWLLDLEMRR